MGLMLSEVQSAATSLVKAVLWAFAHGHQSRGGGLGEIAVDANAQDYLWHDGYMVDGKSGNRASSAKGAWALSLIIQDEGVNPSKHIDL